MGKVLFAVSECVPFCKTGGLADVAGALPQKLIEKGVDVRVVLPYYKDIEHMYHDKVERIAVGTISLNWRNQYVGVLRMIHQGITYYFIENAYYFRRDTLYGHYDDGERFAYFSRAVLELPRLLNYVPDLIHCHDWHTGMIPFLLNEQYRWDQLYKNIRTIFTIHNLQFQGIFSKHFMNEMLELHDRYFTPEQLEFYGNINFMKAGILAADYVTTVSPTYKEEIQYPFFGERLEGLLQHLNGKLYGIINGIDDNLYDPYNDNLISKKYNSSKIHLKYKNKEELQKHLALPVNKDVPIIAMVTRLTKQKGLELVRHVFHDIMKNDIQLIILGTGDNEFERFFLQMTAEYPSKVKYYNGFNEPLAHQIYAGSDMFLMPSLFEPCGLGQMIAMRYGSVPIVRETGGLNDTVHSYDEQKRLGNGFTFKHFNAHDMLFSIERALSYYKQPQIWKIIVKEAMTEDNSWTHSAKEYIRIYERLLTR